MKKVFRITVSIVLVLVLAAGVFLFYLSRGLNQDIELTGIDLTDVNDGVYQGNYEGGRWTNELSVTVNDHKITDIGIVEDITFSSESITKELFDRVKGSQNTQIDTISGATVTSMAYLKSIENAVSSNQDGINN